MQIGYDGEGRLAMSEHAIILLVVVAAAVIIAGACAGIILARRAKEKRTERLRIRFGPEYDRMVAAFGERRAQKLLEEREQRALKIVVRPLSIEDRERFVRAWRNVQSEFVDVPGKAVMEADRLLEELMTQRGYPVGDFEQQAGDLSVHHPRVVGSYRMARVIADSERRGKATTEDLREAIVQYRVLYEELLGRPVSYSEVKQ
jgi:hypothetical protein